MQNCTRSKIAGAIAGMVLGDALGVPGELWPREKVRERFGWIDTFLDGPEDNIVACYFKAAHYTDDSAQAFVVLKALLEYKAVPPVKELAKRLIDWVISMNGFEINLLGPSSKASLLAHSEGRDPSQYLKTALTNGAAMRIAPVGCLIDADKSELLAKTVADISKVTHGTDVAIAGAAMVAQAVASGVAGRSWDEAADDGHFVGQHTGAYDDSIDVQRFLSPTLGGHYLIGFRQFFVRLGHLRIDTPSYQPGTDKGNEAPFYSLLHSFCDSWY